MSSNQPNPYAPPQAAIAAASPAIPDQSKIEAVIKDAGQFWLAILLCIFCSGLGAIIIGPWYFVRLLQWNSLAKAQPMLLDPQVPHGSMAQRFQSAKWKLIVGISFGALMFFLTMLYIMLIAAAAGAKS